MAYRFSVGDPVRVGSPERKTIDGKAGIVETVRTGSYDYNITLASGDTAPVRDEELIRLYAADELPESATVINESSPAPFQPLAILSHLTMPRDPSFADLYSMFRAVSDARDEATKRGYTTEAEALGLVVNAVYNAYELVNGLQFLLAPS